MKNLLTVFSFCFFSFLGFAQLPDYDGEKPSRQHAYWQNKGQVVDLNGNQLNDFLYHTDKCFPDLYLAEDKIAFVFPVIDDDSTTNDTISRFDLVPTGEMVLTPDVSASEQVGGNLNFILPHCVDNGEHNCSNVKGYNRVVHESIYPGINLHTYSNSNGAKLYFEITPEGNPANINLRIDGIDSLNVYPYYLVLFQESETFELPAAFAYQINEDNGLSGLRWIPILNKVDSVTLAFDVGSYDDSKTLVLQIGVPNTSLDDYDPRQNMDWCTYYGGNVQTNAGYEDLVVSKEGKLYTSGSTKATKIPTTAGVFGGINFGDYDVFVTVFDSINQLRLFSTYIGGSGVELGSQITVNDSNNAFVTFYTTSTNMPNGANPPSGSYLDNSFNGGFNDIFVSRLSSNGRKMQWGTYYGRENSDRPWDIQFNSLENSVYVVGTSLNGVPTKTKNGAYNSGSGNGFILKFNETLKRDWATNFGVSGTNLNSLCFDSLGNKYIVGGSPFGIPIVNPGNGAAYVNSNPSGNDAIILKLNENDTIVWSTYFGSSGTDEAQGIGSDGLNIYTTGNTDGDDFVLSNPSSFAYIDSTQETVHSSIDAFFTKFDKDGYLEWSTYFGGTDADRGYSVSVDDSGNVYFSGITESTTSIRKFPYLDAANTYFHKHDGATRGYIAVFKPNLKRTLTTTIEGFRGNNFYSIGTFQSKYLYITGSTYSEKNSFPLVNLGNQAWFDDNKAVGTFNTNVPFAARFDISYFSTLTGLNSNLAFNAKEDFILFPNPSNNFLSISTKTKNSLGTISIYNSLGKLVFEKRVNQNNATFDISSFSRGIYFVKSSNLKISKIFIKE